MKTVRRTTDVAIITLFVMLAIIYFSILLPAAAQSPLDDVKARALGMRDKALPSEYSDIAARLEGLAVLYEKQGRQKDAEELHRSALKMRRKAHPAGHPDIAASLNNLAIVYKNQGRLMEAEPLYKHALEMRQKALGRDHREVAWSLNGLALLYLAQGRLEEAEPLFKRILAMRQRTFPAQHSDIAASLSNLAILYQAQRRLTDAEPLFKSAWEIYEKTLPAGHHDLATSLNNLAVLYEDQEHLKKAEPLYTRVLKMREEALPALHPTIALAVANLGTLYYKQQRLEKAGPLLERALAMRQTRLRAGHPKIARSLNNLADYYQAEGRLEDAERLYKRALAIWETALGRDHSDVGLALDNLAALYRKLGRASDAAKIDARLSFMPPPGTRHLDVYFATNRLRRSRQEPGGTIAFGPEETETLSFGRAVVRIPESELKRLASRREKGEGFLHRARGVLTNAENLKVVRVKLHKTPAIFAESIATAASRSALYKNQALVFVHGYNQNFDEALQRAAQIALDLEFDGLLVPFSWPSKRNVTQYLSDTASADVAVDHLITLVDTMSERLPDVKLHFVAHSMGNLVVLRALERIAERRAAGTKFGELILAHADVDARRCAQLFKNVKPIVAGITLYVNGNDWALWLSEKLRRKARCGATARVYNGVETIDTTGMGKARGLRGWWSRVLSHDVFVRDPLLFGEITRLMLTGQRPPDLRTPELKPVTNAVGKTFWKYDRARDIVRR